MAVEFNKRRVGDTEVKTSEISFGTSGIANLYTEVSDEAAREVLQYAWDSGIRYFDTAPHYGRGLAEHRLGRFLTNKPRNSFVVSSKVGRVLSPGKPMQEADGFVKPLPNDVRYDYSGRGILESFGGSCARLGVDYIDLLYVHDIGELTHGDDNAGHMADLFETGFAMLERLKRDGRIGAFGLGVNECQVCLDILKQQSLDVILLAGRWTLLDRSAEQDLVPLCTAMGTSLVLGGIFNSGILATGAVAGAHFDYAPASRAILQKTRALQEKCEAQGVPLAVAALKFGLAQNLVSSVLIGTGKTSSLARNLSALETHS